MGLFVIVEPVMAILLLAFLFSQCFVPEITGRPWFPLFRRAWRVRGELAYARERISERDLNAELKGLNQEANKCPVHR